MQHPSEIYNNLLKPKHSLVINLRPIVSLILETLLALGRVKFNSDIGNKLSLPELRISGFGLFDSPITQEKTRFLKYSFLQEKDLNVFGCL